MVRVKRLRSVIHSLAHHAVSGLCYVHPYLGNVCKNSGSKFATLDLMNGSFSSIIIDMPDELKLSTEAFRVMFFDLLNIENINRLDIQNASATFNFYRGRWPSSCHVIVCTIDGKNIEVEVNSSGRKVPKSNADS